MINHCPICGSHDYIKTAQGYKCLACDAIFQEEIKKELVAPVLPKVLTASEIYQNSINSVFEVNVLLSDEDTMMAGTAFCISPDGYLITNAHVLTDPDTNRICKTVFINKNGSTDYLLTEVVKVDAEKDLALLKADFSGASFLKFASVEAKIGEKVYAIGNGKGLGLSIMEGIVGDVGRKCKNASAFLCTALVTHGCSGGPILNEKGEVCGVIVSGHKDAPGMNLGIALSEVRLLLK